MTHPAQQPGLVLVVDDAEGNRILAEALLKRIGWTVRTFTDATAALHFMEHTLPQAMLIDVRMPGMSGDDMVRRLRQQYAGVPMRLVGYTAHAMADEVEGFKQAGFDAVLIKPALLADLRRELPAPEAAAHAA